MKSLIFIAISTILLTNECYGWSTTGPAVTTGTTGCPVIYITTGSSAAATTTPIPPPCTPCASSASPDLCCSSSESCFTGVHSSVCCAANSTGCCGASGFSVTGCACAGPLDECCGDLMNTICGPDSCCCSEGTGSASARCCPVGGFCCTTYADPTHAECCTSSELCSRRYGCFTPDASIPLDFYLDLVNTTLCVARNNTTTTTTGVTTIPIPTDVTTGVAVTTGGSTTSSTVVRKVIVENGGSLFKVISTVISDTTTLDNFDVVFQEFVGDAGMFEIYFSYFTEVDNTITITDYKVRFMSIIEFVESGAHEGFQPSEDTIVQRYTLTDETWNPFTGPVYNGDLITFSATTTKGTITLSGYVSDKITPLPKSNSDLNPEQVKFDVDINFTSLYSRPGTFLALEAHIKTWVKINQDSNGFITFFGNKTAAASFSWVPFATTASGEVIPVIHSPVRKVVNPAEPEFSIYFTFDTDLHTPLFWDPSVAILKPRTPPSDTVSIGSIHTVSIAVLASVLSIFLLIV